MRLSFIYKNEVIEKKIVSKREVIDHLGCMFVVIYEYTNDRLTEEVCTYLDVNKIKYLIKVNNRYYGYNFEFGTTVFEKLEEVYEVV